jgi:hypothetical protein
VDPRASFALGRGRQAYQGKAWTLELRLHLVVAVRLTKVRRGP